jgi:hypothetical protein
MHAFVDDPSGVYFVHLGHQPGAGDVVRVTLMWIPSLPRSLR